jgi:hypothetical protein
MSPCRTSPTGGSGGLSSLFVSAPSILYAIHYHYKLQQVRVVYVPLSNQPDWRQRWALLASLFNYGASKDKGDLLPEHWDSIQKDALATYQKQVRG